MEDKNKTITIKLSEIEFNYIKECLKFYYDLLKKLPKNRRTYKFYMLEALYLTKFNSFNE